MCRLYSYLQIYSTIHKLGFAASGDAGCKTEFMDRHKLIANIEFTYSYTILPKHLSLVRLHLLWGFGLFH